MSEVEKSEGGMSKLTAYGALAGTAVGGLWLLASAGFAGTLVLGTLGVVGTAAYGAYTGGVSGAVDNVKSVFSSVTRFYKEAFGIAKKGFGTAKEWAAEQEASRTADIGESKLANKASAHDFAKAANVNTPAVKEAKPAPAPRSTLGM